MCEVYLGVLENNPPAPEMAMASDDAPLEVGMNAEHLDAAITSCVL
jgi:hypothetical protein